MTTAINCPLCRWPALLMEHRGELDPETGYREDATVVDCMNCGTLTCDEVDELLMKENEREYRTDAA